MLSFLFEKKSKFNIVILLFLFLALLTRLILLDRVPIAFSHDEMGYVINAQSIFLTGKGKAGNWQMSSLSPVETYLAELPAVFIAPFLSLPFNSTVNIRLLFVLLSLSLPFLLAEICFSLTKSKNTARFALIIGLFNPWLWQNGRLTFDAIFSLWFYLLGITLFLTNKNHLKLFSLIAFFLGFYCYQGFKLLLPFIGLLLFIFNFFTKKIKNKNSRKVWFCNLIFFVGLLSIFAFYIFGQLPKQAASLQRIDNQFFLPDNTQIKSVVDHDRRLAISSPITSVFVNKYFQFAKEIFGKLMLVFGWRELFFEISASNTSFSVYDHGIFYLIDGLLIGIGLFVLVRDKKYKTLLFLISMLAVGTIPVLVTDNVWLFFRAAFIIPFLIIFSGIGLNQIFTKSKKLFFVFSVVYFIFVSNFTFNYFFRYPLYSAEGIFISPRILASYLRRVADTQKVIVFENEPEFLFTSYIFYNDLFTKPNANIIQQNYNNKNYVMDNVVIQKCIPENLNMDEKNIYIFDVDADYCQTDLKENSSLDLDLELFKEKLALYIKQIKDSGDNYVIYQDKLCLNQKDIKQYVYPNKFKHLAIDSLDNDAFCTTWLTK